MEKRDIIEKYFFGELSVTKKKQLLKIIEADEELRKKFILVQNNLALAEMFPQSDDRSYAVANLVSLEKRIQRKSILRSTLRYVSYAAAIAVISMLWYLIQYTPKNDITYTEYTSLEGKRKEIVLPDSTKIILAPSSKLRVPSDFNTKDRLVELDGEALLTVSRNVKKPFVVNTSKFSIEVLGTVFNVRAYSEHNLYNAELLKGSIKVFDENQSLILKPNEGVSYRDDRLIKTEVNTNYIDFMINGVYDFEEKSLRDLLSTLEIWYNVDFVIQDDSLLDYSLSGKIREENDIEKILKAIQQLCPFNYTKHNNTINIY